MKKCFGCEVKMIKIDNLRKQVSLMDLIIAKYEKLDLVRQENIKILEERLGL